MLAIYEIASSPLAIHTAPMGDAADRKQESVDDALRIARRLAEMRPEGLSEREWTIKAGVSPSFFSNLRGRPKTPPSNPSCYQLQQVLDAIGRSRAEFFAPEAAGRVTRVPTKQALEKAIEKALPGRPRQDGRLAAYLAETVLVALGLPEDQLRQSQMDDEQEAPLLRAATKSA